MEVVTEKTNKHSVPEGYNRTEVGLLPKDWQVTKLKTVADVKTGPFGSLLHQEDYVENGTPIITVEHLGTYGITTQNLPTVSDEDLKRLRAYRLIEGDIVFSRVGSVDRNSLVSKNEDGWLFSGRLLRIRTIDDSISPTYLSYHFSQHSFKERIKEVAVGQTMPSLNTEILNNIIVVLPPTLEEQQAIAEALSDVDALIAELEALIEKKQQVKKGVMQQLLTGKKRLLGFDGEWEEKKLGDITNIVMGSSPSSDNYNDDGYGLPLIGGNADIKNRKSIIRTWTTQIPKKCNADDVIMTVRAPVGTIAIATTESCLGRGVCALQVDSIDKSFLFYQMMFNESEWEALEQGSTFTSANSKQIEEFSITVPENKKEQKAIGRILSDMDAEIEALQGKRAKYEKIKQGMMQELLTGKTRLIKKEGESRKADAQSKPSHNWEFDEAVLVSVLADRFGTKEFPLGRFRRTKYSYLVRRYLESKVDQFLKKAAGPYNPKTRYSGPETIALNNGYVQNWKNKKRTGFIADENIEQAWTYFEDWYGQQVIDWLEGRFRYVKNKELELLTTVDKARIELEEENREVTLSTVKEVIESHPEWQPKLERDLFSDEKIEETIKESFELFG